MPQSEDRTADGPAQARMHHQASWVDLQVKRAMERGEFDNLAGQGKPLRDLGSLHDRDWWLKKLIERERITGVLPAALQLRKDDAGLDALLDREATEKLVRNEVESFNRRIIEARRQLQGGPPVVTATRDLDTEVERWRRRRDHRQLRRRTDAQRAAADAAVDADDTQTDTGTARTRSPRRWFRRSS